MKRCMRVDDIGAAKCGLGRDTVDGQGGGVAAGVVEKAEGGTDDDAADYGSGHCAGDAAASQGAKRTVDRSRPRADICQREILSSRGCAFVVADLFAEPVSLLQEVPGVRLPACGG